jgi:hypothetical protein
VCFGHLLQNVGPNAAGHIIAREAAASCTASGTLGDTPWPERAIAALMTRWASDRAGVARFGRGTPLPGRMGLDEPPADVELPLVLSL